MEYGDNKINFFLKNESVVDFLRDKNKSLYITTALKNASSSYRSFVEFTRKKLKVESMNETYMIISDLFSKGKLKHNTIFVSKGIRVFVAEGAKVEDKYTGVLLSTKININFPKGKCKISYSNSKNDFNSNDTCVEILSGGNENE